MSYDLMANNFSSLRILVVDDNRHTADALGFILRTKGYDVRIAYSAEDAVIAAEEFMPDAAISETNMPGMDGADLALWFNAYHPSCRFLLLSAHSDAAPAPEPSPLRRYIHNLLPETIDLPQLLHLMAVGPAVA